MRLTLPRLLMITFWIGCGATVALSLINTWGVIAAFIGFVLGVTGGITITWAITLGRILLFFPLPLCRQGKCQRFGKDYVWRKGTVYGKCKWGVYLYKCRCGDQYLRRGKKFMEFI